MNSELLEKTRIYMDADKKELEAKIEISQQQLRVYKELIKFLEEQQAEL